MTDSAIWTVRGAEISDRSEELILPEEAPATADDAAWTAAAEGAAVPAAAAALAAPGAGLLSREAGREAGREGGREGGDVDESGTRDAHRTFTARTARVASPDAAPPASSSDSSPNASTPREAENDTRGQALPGDRGPARRSREGREEGSQRPSFWRRIALGRRPASEESPPDDADAGALQRTRQIASRIAASATPLAPRPSAPPEAQPEAVAREVERRIVEPMLQALVSVESKLERSHVDLLGRSDQIEQRLSQLWDIDEQLGALGDLQESLQRVSEQQRRLESAIHAQTRALRWVVGAVALSLAVAAFVVAALLP